ncbi:hypothetical protein B0T14DRAFT_561707 [Immersiella caudata]|uniref:Heterokaryon incompatibility domain-containing protein n=1 Tax=Immersiella caudata TaxID=314043 RepID=A0AA40CE92_9PEZI|nr:hypothetical protein B0T14DRAFT_561707 [Immersiella caudata]
MFGGAFCIDDLDLLEKNGLSRLDIDGWRDTADIHIRRWFNRVWMIQELSLSARVNALVGSQELPWDVLGHPAVLFTFSGAIVGLLTGKNAFGIRLLARRLALAFALQFTRERCQVGTSKFVRLLSIQTLLWALDRSVILWLLAISAAHSATVHLDRVYALLGIENQVSGVYGVLKLGIQAEYKSYL